MQETTKIEEKFIQYSDLIFRIAVTYCKNVSQAEDIVQEVFLRYIKIEKTYENEQHEKAWFIRVAINCCKSHLTSAWMKRILPLEEAESIQFETREESTLHEVIMELPVKYRIVLFLRYYEEYSVNEIAEILHAAPNTISARLSRARKMLKKKITIDFKEDCYYGSENISKYVQAYRNETGAQDRDPAVTDG